MLIHLRSKSKFCPLPVLIFDTSGQLLSTKIIKYFIIYFLKIQILTLAFRIRLDFYHRLSTFQDVIFQVPILGLLPCFPTSAFQTFPHKHTMRYNSQCSNEHKEFMYLTCIIFSMCKLINTIFLCKTFLYVHYLKPVSLIRDMNQIYLVYGINKDKLKTNHVFSTQVLVSIGDRCVRFCFTI